MDNILSLALFPADFEYPNFRICLISRAMFLKPTTLAISPLCETTTTTPSCPVKLHLSFYLTQPK